MLNKNKSIIFLVLVLAFFLSTGCGALLGTFFAEIRVSTHNLEFEVAEGEESDRQDFTAECTTLDAPYDDCYASVTANESWITLSKNEIYGLETVTAYIDATDLEPGSYVGNIKVEYELVSVDDEENIKVDVTVTAAEPAADESEVEEKTIYEDEEYYDNSEEIDEIDEENNYDDENSDFD